MIVEFEKIGLIAGKGIYPELLLQGARKADVASIAIAAFTGETSESLVGQADAHEWVRVGQLGKMIKFFKKQGVRHAIMAGQITPGNLFDLRPDMRTLMMLGKLKQRNAESIFGAIGDELAKDGIELLDATTFMEDALVCAGHVFGPELVDRQLSDAAYAMEIAKQTSKLDIGQTVIVRHGTVLAVEAFEGTNECIRRGGGLGKGQALLAKVSKPNQDFRFDVPVIGPDTVRVAAESGVKALVLEAGRTLILDWDAVRRSCEEGGISVHGVATDATPARYGSAVGPK